jgi:hypothetical protein
VAHLSEPVCRGAVVDLNTSLSHGGSDKVLNFTRRKGQDRLRLPFRRLVVLDHQRMVPVVRKAGRVREEVAQRDFAGSISQL